MVPITTLPRRGTPSCARCGLQDLEAGVHGPGGQEHVGQEDPAQAELLADHVHPRDETLLQNVGGASALLEGLGR